MKYHLVTGGCGFVGRNFVNRLYSTTQDTLLVIDDLSVGTHPNEWLDPSFGKHKEGNVEYFGDDKRIIFINEDIRSILNGLIEREDYLYEHFALEIDHFTDVFHFAAIVGGRATIDGDPMKVALDLAIDALFLDGPVFINLAVFYIQVQVRPTRLTFKQNLTLLR